MSRSILIVWVLPLLVILPGGLSAAESPPSDSPDMEFDPGSEFGLIAAACDSGSFNPEPLQAFIERCRRYQPELLELNQLTLSLASLLFQNQEWRPALELYRQVPLERLPIPTGVRFRIGQCEQRLGDFKAALDSYQQALDTTQPAELKRRIHQAMVECFAALGQTEKGNKVLAGILKEERKAGLDRAFTLARAEKAVDAKQFTTGFPLLLGLLDVDKIDRYSSQAARILATAEQVQGIPRVYRDQKHLGLAADYFSRAGEFARATALLEHLLPQVRRDKDRAEVLGKLGEAWYRQELYPKAIETYQAMLKLLPAAEHQPIQRKIANCLVKQGRYDGAMELYEEIVRQDRDAHETWQARFALAQCCELTGKSDQAIEHYRELLARTSSNFYQEEILFRDAMIRFSRGEPGEALATIEAMCRRKNLVNRKEDSFFWRARLLDRLGRTDESRAEFREFLRCFPGSVYRPLVLQALGEESAVAGKPTTVGGNLSPADDESLALIQAWKIYPNHPLIMDTVAADSFRRIEGLRGAALNLQLAANYRFQFDDDLALLHYGEAQRSRPGDLPLLLTLTHFGVKLGMHRRALVNAEAIRERFDDELDWSAMPARVRQFFFPFPFQEIIFREAAIRRLDPRLLAAVILQESRFDPQAISPAGARGLMQIMPATGESLAAAAGRSPFDPWDLTDAAVNVSLGAQYLASLLETYHGEPALALAAYNAGTLNVDAWLKLLPESADAPDLADILAVIRFRETRWYVKKILVNYGQYRDLYPER